MYATEHSLMMNSYLIPFSKLVLLFSATAFSLLLFIHKLPFLHHFLSCTMFTFMVETMYASSLVLPLISKTFLASMTHALTSAPQYNFYNLFFSLVMALLVGYALRIIVERPVVDSLTLLYFRLKGICRQWY